jgi:hypothetical protein
MADFSNTIMLRRSGGIAVLVAAGAIGLAACGGSTPPHVASLGTSNGSAGATTTTVPTGGTTELLDEWAACMRRHGDPNQVDPTVDTDKVIDVTLPEGYTQGLHGATTGGACGAYMRAAQTALRGGEPPPPPDPATALKFAQCMRANGIPDYPDPSGSGQSAVHATAGSDLDPDNPTFQAASALCGTKTGFEKFAGGPSQPGTINLNMAGGFGGKPGGNGGPAANTANSDGEDADG